MTEIKILTFNLWGIFNSRMKEERMIHFASKVKNYDVILLQEQFTEEDFNLIIQHIPKDVLKTRYFRRFPSSFYGSGCAVISKFPIRSAFFHTYPLQGYPEMVLHGDFFANKGVALIKVDVPINENGYVRNQEVFLYTTHLVAIYQKVSQLRSWKQERYLPFRISQAISLADFITNTSKPTDVIVIGGDFNSSQRSLEVQTLLILLKRRGYVMRSVLPTPSSIVETARNSTEREMATSTITFSDQNRFNSMKTSYFKLLNMGSDIPSQIDHIFFNNLQLSLQGFEDCPDAVSDYPFFVDVEDEKIASGVVVFTQNQVMKKYSPTFAEKLTSILRVWASGRQTKLSHHINQLADWIASKGAKTELNEDGEEQDSKWPISDHYGVAAKLVLRYSPEYAGSPPPQSLSETDRLLSDEESMVLNRTINYLDSYCDKLLDQVKISRYLALLSFASILIHGWLLNRVVEHQVERTTSAFIQLYRMCTGQSGESSQSKSDSVSSTIENDENSSSFKSKLKHFKLTSFMVGSKTEKNQQIVIPYSSFHLLSKELVYRPFWSSAYTSSVLNVLLGFGGLTSFGVGMFQRKGNANILREQARQLRNM